MIDTPVMRHWVTRPVDESVFFGPDPELALVWADMDAWAEAHPCECEALCECSSRERG